MICMIGVPFPSVQPILPSFTTSKPALRPIHIKIHVVPKFLSEDDRNIVIITELHVVPSL